MAELLYQTARQILGIVGEEALDTGDLARSVQLGATGRAGGRCCRVAWHGIQPPDPGRVIFAEPLILVAGFGVVSARALKLVPIPFSHLGECEIVLIFRLRDVIAFNCTWDARSGSMR